MPALFLFLLEKGFQASAGVMLGLASNSWAQGILLQPPPTVAKAVGEARGIQPRVSAPHALGQGLENSCLGSAV